MPSSPAPALRTFGPDKPSCGDQSAARRAALERRVAAFHRGPRPRRRGQTGWSDAAPGPGAPGEVAGAPSFWIASQTIACGSACNTRNFRFCSNVTARKLYSVVGWRGGESVAAVQPGPAGGFQSAPPRVSAGLLTAKLYRSTVGRPVATGSAAGDKKQACSIPTP